MYTNAAIIASVLIIIYFVARSVLAWLFPKDAA